MTILEEIKSDIDWRMGELVSLKTIPHRYKMVTHHKSLLKTYLVPAIYAIWEGFVSNTMMAYIMEINKERIAAKSIRMDVLLYITEMDEKLNLSVPRTNRNQQEKFIRNIYTTFTNPIIITPKIQTKSNVNLGVINHLLTSFGLDALPNSYEGSLNKLLNFRNKIAHGEKAITVKDNHITEFTQLINDLMVEIAIRIEDGLINKTYLIPGY
ncbi:MAG: hypothetical protein J6T43_00950 [Prevotella sp.]|nr:hypothetical protein [Prevotella sp.]